jgi:hypothetical protein
MSDVQAAMAAQKQAQLAARIRAMVALFFIVCGIATATVGAALLWGAGGLLAALGVCLFVVGALVAVIG